MGHFTINVFFIIFGFKLVMQCDLGLTNSIEALTVLSQTELYQQNTTHLNSGLLGLMLI